MRFLLDTSCIVPLVSQWHERHTDVETAFFKRLDAGAELYVSAHSAVEAYSVLTRLPHNRRVSPRQAWQLLDENLFRAGAIITGVAPEQYLGFLRRAVEQRLEGGQVYDALVMAAAKAGDVDELLTLNVRHFQGLEAGRVRVLVP